jgi:hypothetical protein
VGEEDAVCATVRDAEPCADRVSERMSDADERIRKRERGDRGGVRHPGARFEV